MRDLLWFPPPHPKKRICIYFVVNYLAWFPTNFRSLRELLWTYQLTADSRCISWKSVRDWCSITQIEVCVCVGVGGGWVCVGGCGCVCVCVSQICASVEESVHALPKFERIRVWVLMWDDWLLCNQCALRLGKKIMSLQIPTFQEIVILREQFCVRCFGKAWLCSASLHWSTCWFDGFSSLSVFVMLRPSVASIRCQKSSIKTIFQQHENGLLWYFTEMSKYDTRKEGRCMRGLATELIPTVFAWNLSLCFLHHISEHLMHLKYSRLTWVSLEGAWQSIFAPYSPLLRILTTRDLPKAITSSQRILRDLPNFHKKSPCRVWNRWEVIRLLCVVHWSNQLSGIGKGAPSKGIFCNAKCEVSICVCPKWQWGLQQ